LDTIASAVLQDDTTTAPRPTREEAEDAVYALIRYVGDDPAREGLLDTADAAALLAVPPRRRHGPGDLGWFLHGLF